MEENKKRKGMTLPNILTLARILVIPVMIILFYIEPLRKYMFSYEIDHVTYGLSWLYFIEFIIFALASLTDLLDGKIARKYNLVTTFGKFADPLADKMLVFTAMTLFLVDNPGREGLGSLASNPFIMVCPLWIYLIILIREFMASGVRMVAAGKGKVMPARMSGKVKTFVTMVALMLGFFVGLHFTVFWLVFGLMVVSCVLTVYSGIMIFVDAKDIILESI